MNKLTFVPNGIPCTTHTEIAKPIPALTSVMPQTYSSADVERLEAEIANLKAHRTASVKTDNGWELTDYAYLCKLESDNESLKAQLAKTEQLIIDMRAIAAMLGDHPLASVCLDYAARAEAPGTEGSRIAAAANKKKAADLFNKEVKKAFKVQR